MNNTLYKTIKEISVLLDQKKIFLVELTKMVFEHVIKLKLNSTVHSLQ